MSLREHKIRKILAFPKSSIAYTKKLYDVAERNGLSVDDGIFSGFWLLKNLHRYDTVHIHWPSFFYNSHAGVWDECKQFLKFVIFLCFVRLSGKSLFWSAHNLYPHDPCSIPGLHKFARHILVRLATDIFVHGPSATALVKHEFCVPDRKISTVQHGHWIDFYPAAISKNAAREKLGIDEYSYVFLFVGACKNYKNLHGLLINFSGIDPRAKLVIAGRFDDPEYYSELMEIAESIPGNRVRIDAGYIPDEDVQIYLKACDAVVLPYLEILTSGAAILALGFGRPVVAPRKGYLQDIIDERTGILYDPEAMDGLANALALMMSKIYDSDHIRNYAKKLTWDSAVQALSMNIRPRRKPVGVYDRALSLVSEGKNYCRRLYRLAKR